MTELQALVAGVLADPDGAGALADALQEAGREREAVLLRRRWKAWKTQRAKCVADDDFRRRYGSAIDAHRIILEVIHHRLVGPIQDAAEDLVRRFRLAADECLRDYIRSRFAGVRVEDVRYWYYTGDVGHVVSRVSSGMVFVGCDSVFLSGAVSEERPRRVCRKCRKALTTAKPAAGA